MQVASKAVEQGLRANIALFVVWLEMHFFKIALHEHLKDMFVLQMTKVSKLQIPPLPL